jgi:GTP-binding protein
VHVLDIAPEASGGPDAAQSYVTIERELAAHDPRLAALPRVLALSKADLVEEERALELAAAWRERLGADVPVVATSTVTGAGLRALSHLLTARVDELAAATEADAAEPTQVAPGPAAAARDGGEALAEHMVFRPGAQSGFSVERTGPRSFAVRGSGIERLLSRFDPENEDAMAYFESRLRRIGVIKALVAEGFEAGDEVEIGGTSFELDPGARA